MDLRVLLVCPDQASADVLTRILPEMAISPEHVSSLSKGLERLEQERYDAVILDYRSDEASQDFLAKLRHAGVNRAALLIAIVDGEFSARPVFGLGANFVLYRPLSVERTRLSLRAARGLMRRERRRAPRIPVAATVSFEYPGAEDQKAVLVDLSDGGTALHSQRRVPPTCKVYLQFSLPGHPQLVRLSGEMAWQDSTGRTGIRFVDVPQASRKVIQAWTMQNSFRKQKPGVPEPVVPAKPQNPPTALVSGAGNRRGEQRVACKVGAEVYRLGTTVPNRCHLSDVSEGGCYVEMPTPLTGQTNIEIAVRTSEMKFKIRGEVLTVHPGFGMGVRFLFRDEAEKEEVLRLLAILSAGPQLDELPR